MSFVIAAPEFLTAAAMDLASIGSTVSAASAAASAPTVAILAAGADEVSIAVAALFGMHGQAYQALSVQASAFHQQFVQALTAGAYSYASAEAAAVTPLQQLVDVINAPFRSALGRPLIGNGANGKPGTGQDGGAGGLLYGSGGNGGVRRQRQCRRQWRHRRRERGRRQRQRWQRRHRRYRRQRRHRRRRRRCRAGRRRVRLTGDHRSQHGP